MECRATHYKNVQKNCHQECKDSCKSTSYITEATVSKWPLPFQYNSFYEQIIAPRSFADKFKAKNNSVETRDQKLKQMIEDNFLYVGFNLDRSAPYFEMEEVPKYTLASMLGSLGGGLNWLTGITILLFIELVESCIRVGKRCLEHNNKNTGRAEKNHQMP